MTTKLDVKQKSKGVEMKLSRKTMELLLVNYQNLHNGMTHFKPCAEKQKFAKLVTDLEKELKGETL
jgi:hypothetical protein